MSQRENGFRVNSRAERSTNAARRAIRVQSVQGGQPRPGSINGVGSHPRFNSRCKRAMFREPFYHFIPSLVAIVRGILLVVQWLGYMTLTHEIRVQFPAREPCFESHSTTLFQASWLSFEAFCSLMRIGFLYYNCLGFDLASDYTDIIPNTV